MKKKQKMKLCSMAAALAISIAIPNATYAWDSREDANTMDTHKTISVQALQMIKNDMKQDTKVLENLSIIENNILQYKKGSIAPDFGVVGVDRDYKLYQDHFYDPDSGDNFTGNTAYPLYKVPDTAESQLRNYMAQAVAAWKDGDKQTASYLLGKALHYFEDINQPHHALNWTGGLGTAHTNFESYVEEKKDEFKIDTVGADKSEYTAYEDKSFNEFLTLQINKYAKKSKTLESKVSMKNSNEDWYQAGQEGMKNAQIGTASIVYRFLQEVSYGKDTKLTAPIGKFHVVISTEDEKDAGTDDYVYFGMEFNDGKKVEFNCDLPGNDFVRGTTGSYQCEIKNVDYDPAKVKKVWVRKEKLIGDDWKIKDIQIFMQGKRVLKQEAHKWLSGNTSYEINVNGLK